MIFDDFIEALNEDDRNNYLKYSKIRGVQTYRIIYKALSKISNNIKYDDINAFVRYDKAIKDVLYKYLGTLEDFIRNNIFMKFDLKPNIKYVERYLCYKEINGNIIEANNSKNDITKLYSRWSLMFNDTIKFLRKYDKTLFDLDKLEEIRKLRNDVMHHSSLLFNVTGDSKIDKLNERINCLIEVLPNNYNGIAKEINSITKSARKNINIDYACFLLKDFKE